MPTIIIYLLAAASTSGFIALWFWVVRRELKMKQSIVEGAFRQLSASRTAQLQARIKSESEQARAQIILSRSQDVYLQAMCHYNKALKHPLCYFPGLLMGYRAEREGSISEK